MNQDRIEQLIQSPPKRIKRLHLQKISDFLWKGCQVQKSVPWEGQDLAWHAVIDNTYMYLGSTRNNAWNKLQRLYIMKTRYNKNVPLVHEELIYE